MTGISEVIHQTEIAMYDTCYPPAAREREVFYRILRPAYPGAVGAGGSR
jgi:hypothetical protein